MITYRHIHSKDELLNYKESILTLFQECFLKKLEEDLWRWIYLDNPMGDSIVNLAFIDNKLVGHYAFIPISTNEENIYLSVTTMVSKEARKYNVFLELADKSYEFAKSVGCRAIVGFPNAQSINVHKVILGWNIIPTFVANINDEVLVALKQDNEKLKSVCLKLVDKYLQWRLKKPNSSYFVHGNNIYKEFTNSIDLVYFKKSILKAPFKDKSYNILTDDKSLKEQKIFDYPFAYKIFDNGLVSHKFNPQLLMSDVF